MESNSLNSCMTARHKREKLLNQRGCTIWITGLPASGKSTTAFALEHEFAKRGLIAYVLDGDCIRKGLNKDLLFSQKDREQNIRRVAEVAKLFADAGLVVIASLISPYREQRDFARYLHQNAKLNFIEIYIDTPLEICIARDPKGLYAQAKKGHLVGLTGIDDPYEPPLAPEFTVHTLRPPELIAEEIVNDIEPLVRIDYNHDLKY